MWPKHVSKVELIISAIFLAICTFTCSILSSLLSTQLCMESNRTKDKMDTICKMIILCAFLSTLCNLSDFFRHMISYPLNNIMGVADFVYYFTTILFYIIALCRVQISFRNTKYAIHPYILIFLYGLIVLVFMSAMYYTIIVFITPNISYTQNNNNFYLKYDIIPMITIGLIDFIINTSLLTLFISKLKQLLNHILPRQKDLTYQLTNKSSSVYISSSNLVLLITRHFISASKLCQQHKAFQFVD
eukprot:64163_1